MGIVAGKAQEHVRQQLAGEGVNPRPAHATGTVHHDAVLDDGTVVHHHQRFESGELVEWERDDAPGPHREAQGPHRHRLTDYFAASVASTARTSATCWSMPISSW